MPGVHAVVTHADVPLNEYGHLSGLGIPADEPLLAVDEVRYKGQPIALVAAVRRGDGRRGGFPHRDRLRGAARADRRPPGVRRGRPEDPPLGQLVPALRGRDGPAPDPEGRHRVGVRERGHDRPGRVSPGGDRACPDRDAGVPGRPRAERPADDLLVHAGALLLDGRRRRAPPGAAQQAEVRRRHDRRRLRRQGGHGDGDDVLAARPEVGQAGEVALDARGGVPLLVHPRALAHGDRGRADEGRLDPRPQDAHAPRRGRVRALLALRPHEAQLPPHGRVHDPEPRVRRVRRLHEPRADDRDARLRRDLGLVRDGDAHEPRRRRARARPDRDPDEEREPDRRHLAERRRLHRPLDRPDDPGDRRGDRPRTACRVRLDDERARAKASGSRSTSSRRSEIRRTTDGKAHGQGNRRDRVPDGHEPERRPVAVLDQGQARRAHRRLRGHRRYRQRVEDHPVPDRRRDHRRPLRLDHVRQLEYRLVADVHGHVRVAGDLRRRAKRPRRRRSRSSRSCSRSRARSSRSILPTSRSSTAR